MSEEKDKSFMDDAKGFLSMWKEDYGNKNKDILERAEKRREEAAAEQEEMKKLMSEISVEFDGMAKDMYELLKTNVQGFTEAVKEGSATVADKLELEERMKQLNDFLAATKNKSAEEFNRLSAKLKSKIDGFDSELQSERESMGDDAMDELKKRQSDMENDIDKNHKDIKNLFSDDE